MTRCDEQKILLSSTKTEWKCTRAERRSLMKILSAWWNFRSSKCWNLFLSVDRLKLLFWSHLWKICLFLNYLPRMNHWDEQIILLSSTKKNWKCTRAAKKKSDEDIECMVKLQKLKRLETVSKRRQVKNTFFFTSMKNLLLLKYPPRMNRWDEQIILLSSTKTESKCTRAAKRSLLKILSTWWNFRNCECWNLFLSVDRLKPFFGSHLWKNCLFLKCPQWMNHWGEQSILPS